MIKHILLAIAIPLVGVFMTIILIMTMMGGKAEDPDREQPIPFELEGEIVEQTLADMNLVPEPTEEEKKKEKKKEKPKKSSEGCYIGEAATGKGGPGDQSGKEVSTKKYYHNGSFGNWSHVFRFKDSSKASQAAQIMEDSCNNNKVGYYNGTKKRRLSYYYELEKAGGDATKISSNCETACSQMVSAICHSLGLNTKLDVNTMGLKRTLTNTGAFDIYTSSDYTDSPAKLQPGDILMTARNKGSNHVCMVVKSSNEAEETDSDLSWVELKGGITTGKIYDDHDKLLFVNGRQDLVSVGDGGAGGNGIVTSPGAQGAVEWARAIAEDDSFAYGAPAETSQSAGCYFCGTNTGPNKYKKGHDKRFEKTYCCNVFITAAYAHGANEPKALETCKGGGCFGMQYNEGWSKANFKDLGKPDWSEIQNGDVLSASNGSLNHVWMVTDVEQDLYVEAASVSWDEDSISEKKGAKKSYGRAQWVYRYVGNGQGGTTLGTNGGSISGLSGSGASGALAWAKKIADDDSYAYYLTSRCPEHHGVAKYFCCASFVTAAYAHGAGDSKIDKHCESGDSAVVQNMYNNFKKSGMFTDLGAISVSQMQPGDVIIHSGSHGPYSHTEIYFGNGKEVGAHGRDGKAIPDQISVRDVVGGVTAVLRYKGGGGVTPITHKEYNKETIIKTFDKNNCDLIVKDSRTNFRVVQSMAYLGDGEIAVLENDTHGSGTGHYGKISVYNSNGEHLRSSEKMVFYHGNGMTCKDGTIYVTSGSQKKDGWGRKVDAKTLKDLGTFHFPWNTQGIGYDRVTTDFGANTGTKIFVADGELKRKKINFSKMVSGLCQDSAAHGGVIYNCTSNKINLYDESSGKYYGSYKTNLGRELESCDIDEQGRLIMTINDGNQALYRTKESVATAEAPGQTGEGMTGLTVREDIRVLVRYKKEKAKWETTVVYADEFKPTEEQLQVANKVAAALTQRGYTKAGIAGALGNLHHESSGMDTGAIEGNGGGGHGLCQWTGVRWTRLQDFAKARGKDWKDLDLQIEFFCHELDNDYPQVDEKLRTITDVAEATKFFMDEFEKPSIPHLDKRLMYANGYYGTVSGAAAPGNYSDAEISIHIDLRMMKAVCKGRVNGRLIEGAGDVSGSIDEKNVKFSLKALAASTYGGETVNGRLDGMRTEYPEQGNKFYFGGANGFPRNDHGGNCTWYAWGRFMEIAGKTDMPYVSRGDAVTFYDTTQYEKGTTPKLGAIACWGYGSENGHPGHVAVVEEIKPNGDIVCSNSGWSGERFWISTHKASEKYAMHHGNDVFRGFIYQP